MAISEVLKNEALMSLNEFDEKWLIGNNKPAVPLGAKFMREFERIYIQKKTIKKSIKPLVYFLKQRLFTKDEELSIPSKNLSEHQVVLVLYQPCGISDSWKRTIREISEMNVCLTIIANGGVPKEDEIFLKNIEKVFLYSRFNYGLDFGAYRVAILSILTQKITKKITIINDSIFFPIFGSVQDLFNTINQKNESFVGLVENTNRDPVQDFHYGSFFIQIKEPFLRSDDFYFFWKQLKISESKKKTIERGEKGLSKLARDRNYSCSVVYDYNQLMKKIITLESINLVEVLDDVILCYSPEWRVIQEKYRQHLIDEYEDSELWKKCAIEWISHVVEPFNKTHSCAVLYPKLLKMPLLKRDLMRFYGEEVWQKLQYKLSPISEMELR